MLRCNITSEEHPLGVFRPHAIKKENNGLIEVIGLKEAFRKSADYVNQ